jgi:hypothetical protein
MRFKKADEMEKAERLKTLHTHQLALLEAEEAAEQAAEHEKQAEQVVQLISNRHGRTGSFPGDISSRSSLITAPVTFGNQTFDLTLDTGSTVLWVTSASCKSTACRAHRQYDAGKSDSFQLVRPSIDFEIEYGSGTIQGTLATELVGLGTINVPSQLFGLVTMQEGSTFEHAQWSGLLGLAYPSLASFDHVNPALSKPFFDSIIEKKLLNQNAFSFWLVKSEVSPPMFFLGAPPPQYYKGTLEFFDVVEKYYWTLELLDILVDGQSLGICPPPKRCRVVVDSGTSYMTAPSADLPDILKALHGESADDACQQVSTKVITYMLGGGRNVTLEPDHYFTRSYTGEYCKAKYIALDVEAPHGPVHIFGDVFFRKYFVHFDRDSDRVGFAVARNTVSESHSTSLQSLIMEKLYMT